MATEKRLIDANALKSQITRYHMSLTPRYISKLVDAEIGDVIDIIDETPTVDAVEVVYGRWEQGDYYDCGDVCSVCDWDSLMDDCDFSYCPNCGAKMDGGKADGKTSL